MAEFQDFQILIVDDLVKVMMQIVQSTAQKFSIKRAKNDFSHNNIIMHESQLGYRIGDSYNYSIVICILKSFPRVSYIGSVK